MVLQLWLPLLLGERIHSNAGQMHSLRITTEGIVEPNVGFSNCARKFGLSVLYLSDLSFSFITLDLRQDSNAKVIMSHGAAITGSLNSFRAKRIWQWLLSNMLNKPRYIGYGFSSTKQPETS